MLLIVRTQEYAKFEFERPKTYKPTRVLDHKELCKSKQFLKEEVKTVKAIENTIHQAKWNELKCNSDYSEILPNCNDKSLKYLAESPERDMINKSNNFEAAEDKRTHSGKAYRDIKQLRNFKITDNSSFVHPPERDKSTSRRVIMAWNRFTQSQKSLIRRRRKKQKPDFDLSTGNPLNQSKSKIKRRKGFISNSSRRQVGVSMRRNDYSSTVSRSNRG